MTYREMRDNLQRLTREERQELALDLKAIALLDDSQYMAELDRIMEETERGQRPVLTEEQVREILAARGRAAA